MDKKFWAKFSEEPFVDKFVGREDLLAKVDEAVADVPNRHLITFVGEGGIGKTALLRKIYNKYKCNHEVIVISIDYSQAKFRTFPTSINSFFYELQSHNLITESESVFFQNKVQEVRSVFAKTPDDKSFYDTQIKIAKLLAEIVNTKSKNKRILILVDSIEKGTQQGSGQRDAISELKNTVVILVGRPEIGIKTRLKKQTSKLYKSKGWNVDEWLMLNKFSIDETRAYFTQVLPVPLQPELIETIHILTAGKPILLAFMIEWFKHNVRLPDHINKSKKELEDFQKHKPFHFEMLREDFELELIRRVQAVETPLDKALLFLSFLDRRYDKRILQLALKRPIEEIERLEAELRRMAFVRSFLDDSSGLLHDEAKRLIYQYAWPPYDPKHKERTNLARKVIDGFYLPEIKRLRAEVAADTSGVPTQAPEEILAHELEMECLDYHYRISLDEGRRYVTQLIEEGISLRKREGMRHEITMRADENEANVAVARMNLRRGQLEPNREIIEQAVKQKNSSAWYKTTLLYELSDAHSDPQEKAAYLVQAIEIAKQSQDQAAIAKIYHDLGLMYQRHSLSAKAEESYQRRLALIDDPEQKAATLNNLASVKLLQGEIEEAKSLASMALEIGKMPMENR